MGGRGASFGKSAKGKPYGTEYRNAFENGATFFGGRLKFVKQIDDRPKGTNPMKPKSVTAPMETMSKGRIYATLDAYGKPSTITFYRKGKRIKQIDLDHPHQGMQPHTHRGYLHDENGTRKLNKSEKKIVDFVHKTWNNKGGA